MKITTQNAKFFIFELLNDGKESTPPISEVRVTDDEEPRITDDVEFRITDGT